MNVHIIPIFSSCNRAYYFLKTINIIFLLHSNATFSFFKSLLPIWLALSVIGQCTCQIDDDYKVHLQVKINIGSPVNNIGVGVIGEYLGTSGTELALGYDLTYNFRNYGIPGRHIEHHIFGTAHYLWGSRDEVDQLNNFIKLIDSRRSANSFGYTFEYFYNQIGSAQKMGTFHFRFDDFTIQFSNDLLGHFNYLDRFRTGAVGLGWIEQENYFNMNMLFWTGDSTERGVKKYREGESEYPARFGYRALDSVVGGKYSHGILSFGVIRDVGSGQNAGIHLGIDAEQIRNVVQNKVFHDMYFIPSFLENPKNLHIPMKMEDGNDYLFEENQKIRNPKLVWQLTLNPNLLY